MGLHADSANKETSLTATVQNSERFERRVSSVGGWCVVSEGSGNLLSQILDPPLEHIMHKLAMAAILMYGSKEASTEAPPGLTRNCKQACNSPCIVVSIKILDLISRSHYKALFIYLMC